MEGLRISDIATENRPRERLMQKGAEYLSNGELLALIISSGQKDQSALTIANNVLALEKGGLACFSNYLPWEFEEIEGIGPATSSRIVAAIELGKRINKASRIRIDMCNPKAASEFFADMRHLPYEVLRVAMLNAKMELIKCSDVGVGGLTGASARPREVFAAAVKCGAYCVIIAHNHPSGDPKPSQADISTTDQLIAAGSLLGIEVQDHIIIGDGSYYSFREGGLIKQK